MEVFVMFCSMLLFVFWAGFVLPGHLPNKPNKHSFYRKSKPFFVLAGLWWLQTNQQTKPQNKEANTKTLKREKKETREKNTNIIYTRLILVQHNVEL